MNKQMKELLWSWEPTNSTRLTGPDTSHPEESFRACGLDIPEEKYELQCIC